ncbi:MAG: RecX family transcriptional regulator [Clostridia bacterium]|nr:RecX family transcriptional regulator [Clostridia bacterium]
MEYSNNLEELEKIDKLKNKVLKYILYKKRTEKEVREKFQEEIDENTLEDIIEFMKENNYLNDSEYIERAVNEFMALKNMSIREIEYKLSQKGVNKNLIDDYICKNKEIMLEYELRSATNIVRKKINSMEEQDIKSLLFKRGYMSEIISIAIDEGKE